MLFSLATFTTFIVGIQDRKDTQPENTRVQPPQGVPTSTSRISSLLTSMRVCALGLGSKWGGPKAAVG
jgi:hypothetical protein